jgi:hypothetical protein
MRIRDTCSAIFLRKHKTLWRVQWIRVCFVLVAIACQWVSLARTPDSLETLPSGVAVRDAQQIPDGYILPVQLERTLSIKSARPGDAIEARIMQEVPLPNREKVALRSRVKGTVLSVARDPDETGVELTVRFDRVSHHRQNLSVTTSLRAIASYMAVHQAEMPAGAFDAAFPRWEDTVQIGGDLRYGDGFAVRNRQKEKVGMGVLGGVLAYAKANPALGCDGPGGADRRLQALWLFSSDACGVYGFQGVELVRNGQSSPVGEITLHFKKPDMKLSSGTGMLLSVIEDEER